MNIMKRALVVLTFSFFLAGCAATVSPVTGFWYTNVDGPITATSAPEEASRVGRASATSVLGIIATGDASIQQAARNGGISEIHHVDFEARSYIGVLAEFTVVVYGN